MTQQQNQQQGQRKASRADGSATSSTLETIQKTWAKVPTPSRKAKIMIASGIALGAVGVAAYMMARRKPASRLGLLGGLVGPAMVAWNAYQSAVKTGKEEIESRLH
jgi:hypothetical protein